MPRARTTRNLLAVLLVAAVLLAGGSPASARDDEKEARHSLEQARKAQERRMRRGTPLVEAQGAVTAVNATARTFEVQVKQSNQATLRGRKVVVRLARDAFTALNDRRVALGAIKPGDGAKVTGLLDGVGVTAYLVRFRRTAPAPAQVKGTVATVGTTGFTLTVDGQPVTFTLGTPSIVTLNGQTATLADIHVGDKGEVTSVNGVAYVARFTRALPPSPGPTRTQVTVTSTSPLTFSTPIVVATPSVVSLDDSPATPADLQVGDRCTVVGIGSPSGLVAYLVACRRSS